MGGFGIEIMLEKQKFVFKLGLNKVISSIIIYLFDSSSFRVVLGEVLRERYIFISNIQVGLVEFILVSNYVSFFFEFFIYKYDIILQFVEVERMVDGFLKNRLEIVVFWSSIIIKLLDFVERNSYVFLVEIIRWKSYSVFLEVGFLDVRYVIVWNVWKSR